MGSRDWGGELSPRISSPWQRILITRSYDPAPHTVHSPITDIDSQNVLLLDVLKLYIQKASRPIPELTDVLLEEGGGGGRGVGIIVYHVFLGSPSILTRIMK